MVHTYDTFSETKSWRHIESSMMRSGVNRSMTWRFSPPNRTPSMTWLIMHRHKVYSHEYTYCPPSFERCCDRSVMCVQISPLYYRLSPRRRIQILIPNIPCIHRLKCRRGSLRWFRICPQTNIVWIYLHNIQCVYDEGHGRRNNCR